MNLYHFCAPQFLEGIQKYGLVLGSTPVVVGDKIGFMQGTQWLTIDGSFDQSWNGRVSIKYDRCAYRLDIHIPEDKMERLWTWSRLKGELQVQCGADCIVEGFDDPAFCRAEDWRIYLGIIQPSWIGEVVPRPGGPNSDLVVANERDASHS